MSRRCFSSKPTPTPLNGKATKPAQSVHKKSKEDPQLSEAGRNRQGKPSSCGGGRGRTLLFNIIDRFCWFFPQNMWNLISLIFSLQNLEKCIDSDRTPPYLDTYLQLFWNLGKSGLNGSPIRMSLSSGFPPRRTTTAIAASTSPILYRVPLPSMKRAVRVPLTCTRCLFKRTDFSTKLRCMSFLKLVPNVPHTDKPYICVCVLRILLRSLFLTIDWSLHRVL